MESQLRKLVLVLSLLFFVQVKAYWKDTITVDSSQVEVMFQSSQDLQDLQNMQREMVLPEPQMEKKDTSKEDALVVSVLTACILGTGLWWKLYKQKRANQQESENSDNA